MSMVRFLVYANQWDVEGPGGDDFDPPEEQSRARGASARSSMLMPRCATTSSCTRTAFPPPMHCARSSSKADRLRNDGRRQGNGFGRVPSCSSRQRPQGSAAAVGAVWGGPNVLAQALWKVRATRSRETTARVRREAARLHHLRPGRQRPVDPQELSRICSTSRARGFTAAAHITTPTWSGISGDRFHGRFAGADFAIVDNPWLDEHMRSKGPAGRAVPAREIPDGRRHAELSQSHRQWLERSRASGLGRLGRTLRVLHAAHAQVVRRTRDPSVLDRRRGRSAGRGRQLAHLQQGHDLALARGLSERFRRAHGLDHQAATRRRIIRRWRALAHADRPDARSPASA